MSALTLSTLSVAGGAISAACLRLNSAAMPAAMNSTTATMTAAAHTGRTSASAATAAAIKGHQAEDCQQTRGADQAGADAGMLDRFLQLFLREPHLVADEP